MKIDSLTLFAIVGMAVVTYLTKAGGLWTLGRTDISPRMEAGLEAIPGAVLVSLVAPVVITGGIPEWGAAVATLAVAWRTGNILLSMITGVGIVWLLRQLLVSPLFF
jgi:uncharacterized membrane protein